MGVAAIVLAAGSSSRLGTPKQSLEYRGCTLLRHAAETALASRCDSVYVVLGSEASKLQAELDELPVRIVENERWAEGMGTSIQAGLAALPAETPAAILMLCDQPLITPEILDRLIAEEEASGQPVVASEYAGTVGVPALFARASFPELLALTPDQGCKRVILAQGSRALRIPCPEATVDVDTASDYRRLRESDPAVR